jgi:glutamate dehydrogenase
MSVTVGSVKSTGLGGLGLAQQQRMFSSARIEADVFQMVNAAAQGQTKVLASLLEGGLDVNQSDYDMRTALHLAASEQRLPVVKFLVEKGAAVNVVDRFGGTPLEYSIMSKNKEMTMFLVANGATLPADRQMVVAEQAVAMAGSSDLHGLGVMLLGGVDVDCRDPEQRTPLCMAAHHGSVEACEFLLANGANPNVSDMFGLSPAQHAKRLSSRKFRNCLAVLEEAGARVTDQVHSWEHPPAVLTSLEHSLPLILEMSRCQYGESWIPAMHREDIPDGGELHEFVPGMFWSQKAFERVAPEFVHTFPNNSTVFTGGNDVSLNRAFKTKEPQFATITREEFPARFTDIDTLKDSIQMILTIPIVFEDSVRAIVRIMSRTDVAFSEDNMGAVREFQNYVSKMVAAGIFSRSRDPPFVKPEGATLPEGQMEYVFRRIVGKGVFNANTTFHEVQQFYNLGIMPHYFTKFDNRTIANHIHSYMASRKLSVTTGQPDELWLHVENNERLLGNSGPEQSLHMISSDKSRIRAAERRLEQRIAKIPPNKAYSMEYFLTERSHTAADPINGKKLSVFVLKTHEFVDQSKVGTNDCNIWEISSDAFLRDTSRKVRDRYQDLINECMGRLSPVARVFDEHKDGTIPMMFAFRMPLGSQLNHLTELVNQNGLTASRKFIETFANGVVVYSLYIAPEAKLKAPQMAEKLKTLTSQFQMLHLIPSSPLTNSLLQNKISANEYIYLTTLSRFVYYFVEQRFEEYDRLADFFKNDPVNLSRLRSMGAKYRREALSYSRIYETFAKYPAVTKALCDDFIQRISTKGLNDEVSDELDLAVRKVGGEVDRQLFRCMINFNRAVLKTNFYKEYKAALSFRLDPTKIMGASYEGNPVPFAIIFVVGAEFQGFHVRFADVARGGIRLIISRDKSAYESNLTTQFKETFGLAHTQNKKNKDIPEFGSKGTILPFLHEDSSKEINGFECFKKYISSLLDIMLVDDVNMIDNYGKPELLFLGPDEGTANMMQWAAEYAHRKDYMFWRSFTTGKPPALGGIPHDTYGMTTRSVRQYVKGCMEKLGWEESAVTKVQTGGPDGDLGSNEILLSKEKTVAIVDGSGVLYDPNGLNRDELVRLATERVMVEEFDRALLSEGGFMVLVNDENISLPDGEVVLNGVEFRNEFHLHRLCTADLFVPCGGRPEAVNLSNVDRMFHENGTPKFKVVVEGANLFFSQDARNMLDQAGVVLYKDASTNKGGVTSSSKEVLAALALDEPTFDAHVAVRKGQEPPEFYNQYVQDIIRIVEADAYLEFECIWNEHERTGIARYLLTDELSDKINMVTTEIAESTLFDIPDMRRAVLQLALPPSLLELSNLEDVMTRVPENYQKAIFSTYLASRFVYKYGIQPSDFALYEYLTEIKDTAAEMNAKVKKN